MSQENPSANRLANLKQKTVTLGETMAQRPLGKDLRMSVDGVMPPAQAGQANKHAPVHLQSKTAPLPEVEASGDQQLALAKETEEALASQPSRDSEAPTWTLAQASVAPTSVVDTPVAACTDKAPPSQDCDDDKGLVWWHQGAGGWLKTGLAGAGLLLLAATQKNKDETIDLETGMAAGPFKASGMKLKYFGTTGLLLELSWDANGNLTVDANTALEGNVQVHTSFVDTGNNQRLEVVTGVSVKFATYTGALLAVLVDEANDNVPVEYYDEVAGLMALEGTLSAFTTIKTGQNTLAITPFTELALRKANIDIGNLLADPDTSSAAMVQLLNNSTQTTAIQAAIEEVNTLVGVDITQVLPTAVNDRAYASETDALAKSYGEKLASLSRLVPGNLEGGLERLLNAAPASVPDLLSAALADYRDDNDPSAPRTPPSVTLQRPWVNAEEGAQPLQIRGTSLDADDGSVVRISVTKNGVLLLSLKAEVSGNAWSAQLTQTWLELGVADGDALTIKAYIDPDHAAQVEIVYDATAPAAPMGAPDLLALDDTGLSASDNDTSVVQPRLNIGELPEAGMTVALLVDGEVVPATYANGVLQPVNALDAGVHTLSFRYIDRAGNRSENSPPLSLNVDTAAPGSVVSLGSLSRDTGANGADWITNVAGQTVNGTLSEPLNSGEILRASLDGGATWTDITTAVNGTTLRWLNAGLNEGTSTLQMQVVDAAGNAGPIRSRAYTLDTTAPAAPGAAPDLQASSDTRISTDNKTSQNQPVLDVLTLPAGATAAELLVNGQVVAATFDPVANTLRPNVALSDATHNLSYRFVDAAGNRSLASPILPVTVDTQAPQSTYINRVDVAAFAGTYEPGSTLTLSIAGVPVTGDITTNPNGTWTYQPSTQELDAMRENGAVSELLLTVTDTAGNQAQNSRTVTADDLKGPYVKEFIPTDGGFLANATSGNTAFATLNLVFSKTVVAGTGKIKLWNAGSNALVAEIDVNTAAVQIVDGRDVFVTLPSLTPGVRYYVTLDAGTFADTAAQPLLYTGKSETGTAGWDFVGAQASIAPNFVAQDDIVNAAENTAVVSISGKVVGSAAILEDILAANLSVSVAAPQGAQAVNAALQSYNNQTGEFVFNVPAQAWANGRYGYTVSLRGTAGDAANIQADYNFANLAVDLVAPTGSTSSVDVIWDDAGRVTGNLWADANVATTDDTTPYISGTLTAALAPSEDTRVVVYRRDVTSGSSGNLVRITGPEGLKPTGTSWSVGDSGLQDGHRYEYVAYVEDAAGNRSSAMSVKTLSVDTSPPTAQVTGMALSQDTGASNTDRITNIANQDASGTLSAPLGEGETLLASLDGGITWSNITAGVSGTAISVPGLTLPAGSGQVLFKVQDAAGNTGPQSQLGYTLDQTPPAAPTTAPDLLSASDSGNSSYDDITRENRPYLVIGALPQQVAGAQLRVDGEVVEAIYNANDRTLRPVQALSHGEHSFSFSWLDTAGNASEAGPALTAQIDSVAPSSRLIQIAVSNDTGSSATDLVTKVAAQNVTAQLSGALFTGDRVWASADGGSTWTEVTSMVSASGQLGWNGISLTAGTNSLQFKVIDVAGNEGAISTQPYTLDTTPPALTVTDVQLSNDTGVSASDFITRLAPQTVTGQLQLGGTATALASGERLMGSSNGGVTWQDITTSVDGTAISWANVTLSNGTNSLRFKTVDLAGNEGSVSTQATTLDTVPPAAPSSFAWATYPNGINTSTNTVSGTIGDVPFTYTLKKLDQTALNLVSTPQMFNQVAFPVSYGVPNSTSIRNDVASINQLTFDSPMSNPVLAFSSIGNPSNPVTISFPVPVEILWSTDVTVDQGTTSAATRVTGREGFMVVRLNGTVDDMRFDYLSNETYVNFAFGAAVFDLLSPEQDTGIKNIDDITQVNRPNFKVQNKPADAVGAELLVDGRVVDATFSAEDNTLTPNVAMADGVYQVSYRYLDVAGNASAAGSVTQVAIDTRAPVNTALTTFTPGEIAGTYEPGTSLSLKMNGVDIAASRLRLDATSRTWYLVPSSTELNQANTGLLNKATSTFELIATDLAGNVTTANATVGKDVFNAPYVKEFIPADSGVLANDITGHATLNLVFSKSVSAGTGKVKLWNATTNALVTEINVTGNAVSIENGTDVYVTLPAVTNGVSYYVTLDSGTFVDNAGQAYLGKTETGTAGWDFVGALASIAPNFVAQDDIVNAAENTAVVAITGKMVGSAAILEDIVAGNLTVSVTAPQGAQAVSATLQSYNNQTGEFVFNVPAQAWANGSYGYTVRLRGTAGDAANIHADYNFANLAVDLLAPTGISARLDRVADNEGGLQGNLLLSNLGFLGDGGFATSAGTNKVTDVNVTDLDLTTLSANLAGGWISPNTGPAIYNTASTVYSSDRSSVSFWVQTTKDTQYTKAVKLQLTDTLTGVELKILAAKNLSGAIATSFNWNSAGTPVDIATGPTVSGYGLSALNFIGLNGFSDDTTPTLSGALTRNLAPDEHIAIDRTNGQGQTVTVTGKAGLIVDGTTWAFDDGTLADGQYTYRVYVEDNAGNRTTSSTARTITVDRQAPIALETAVTLSQDTGADTADRITKEAVQTITGTLSQSLGSSEKLLASMDGVTYIDVTRFITDRTLNWTQASLKPGAGTLKFVVEDAAGNQSTVAPFNFISDQLAPTGEGSGSASIDENVSIGTEVFRANFTDNRTNTLDYAISGADAHYFNINSASGAVTLKNSPDFEVKAKYNFVVSAVDVAGNIGTQLVELTINDLLDSPPSPILSLAATGNLVASSTQQIRAARALGDINGDGFDDIAFSYVTGANTINQQQYVLYGSGSLANVVTASQLLQDRSLMAQQATQNAIVSNAAVSSAGDFNNDGKADVLVGFNPTANRQISEVNIYLNNQAGIQSVTNSKIVGGGIVVTFAGQVRTYNDNLGYANAMQAAGDINGDGIDDIIVGAPQADILGNYQGQAYAIFGSNSVMDVNVSSGNLTNGGFKFTGADSFGLILNSGISAIHKQAALGTDVAGVGDFNGDGLADFLVRDNSPNTYNWGPSSAWLVFGKANGAYVSTSYFTNKGILFNNLGGWPSLESGTLSYAGDFNGDGRPDLIIGDQTTAQGTAYIVFGGYAAATLDLLSLVQGSQGLTIHGLSANEKLNATVSYAGDINADGLSDVILASMSADSGNGRAYVVYGRAGAAPISLSDINNGVGGFAITTSTGKNLGSALSNAGDVNGDGLEDLMLSQQTFNGTTITGPQGLLIVTNAAVSGSKVSQMGTAQADDLSDNGISQSLIGGLGDDRMLADSASVLYGGAGNDSMTLGQNMVMALYNPFGLADNTERLARIDGGTGLDTLKLAEGVNMDLTQVANQAASLLHGGSRIDDIEIIDLTSTGANNLKLKLSDVIDMSSANLFEETRTGRQQLVVQGTSADTVDLADGTGTLGWTQASDTTINSVAYQTWNHNTAAATVYVQSGMFVV